MRRGIEMQRLWRTVTLVLLMMLSLVGIVSVPKVNADRTVADLSIVDFILHKGELLWFWRSQVYFRVVSYAPLTGWVGYGADVWDTRDYPSPGGWKTDVEKNAQYVVNYHNQVGYELSSFVRGYSVTFDFYAYKNGWWGDEQLLAQKVNFDLRPGPQKRLLENNDIEFHVIFDWEPCHDGQSWTGTACVCPVNQEWNGEKCVPATTTVSVYALPDTWQGSPANSASSDLGATITVRRTLHGESQPVLTQQTPFTFQADIGSEMSLFENSLPKEIDSDWRFACNWDQYGVSRHPGECSLTTTVGDNDQIAAFFIRQCPDGQSWDGSKCVCPGGKEWNGRECVIPEPSCPDDQVWTGSKCVCPLGEEWNGQECVVPEPSCPDGQVWTGSQCVCPLGEEWNGQECGKRETELTHVSVWALGTSYSGQDPAGLESHDLHASIYMDHIWHGQLYRDAHVTPFVIDADVGSTITFTVESPSGFMCAWDHYGFQQYSNTCTLEIQVGHNDKIVAFFGILAYQGNSSLAYAASAGGRCGSQCTTEVQDNPPSRASLTQTLSLTRSVTQWDSRMVRVRTLAPVRS